MTGRQFGFVVARALGLGFGLLSLPPGVAAIVTAGEILTRQESRFPTSGRVLLVEFGLFAADVLVAVVCWTKAGRFGQVNADDSDPFMQMPREWMAAMFRAVGAGAVLLSVGGVITGLLALVASGTGRSWAFNPSAFASHVAMLIAGLVVLFAAPNLAGERRQ